MNSPDNHKLLLGNVFGSLYLFDKKSSWKNLNKNKELKDLWGINFMFTHNDVVIIGTPLSLLIYKTEENVRKLNFDYRKWGSPLYIFFEKLNSTYWLLTTDNNLLNIDISKDTVKVIDAINLGKYTTDDLLSFIKINDIFFFTTYSSGIFIYKHFSKTYFQYRQIGIRSVPTILKAGNHDDLYYAGDSYFGIITNNKLTYFTNFDKIQYSITNLLKIDNNHFLLAADGFGIISYNLKSKSVKYLPKNIHDYIQFVTCLEKSENDTVWLSSEKLLAKYKDTTYIKYMLSVNDSIIPYDETQASKNLLCQKILYDSIDNRIWIASFNKLFYYQNGLFFSVKKKAIKNIFDIVFDKNHLLWIISNGNNLLRYNPANNTVKNFNRFIQQAFDGIEDNSLFQVRIDAENKLWVNSKIALQLDNNSNIINRYCYISHPYFNNNFVCSLHDVSPHYIWFATDEDIQKISIDSLYKITKIPNPVISEVKINDNLSRAKNVDYKQDFWTFKFQLPYFLTNHKNIIYFYRLVGFDNQWHITHDDNPVYYYSLEPDNYEFQLKAKFIDQPFYSDTIKYHFIINPPFWKTYWFIIIIISILVSIVFYIIHKRINRIKEKAFISNRINQLKLKVVQSQIKPHFLFNFLNNIQDNILKNEQEIIIEHLSILSKFIRQTLEYSDLNKIILTKELDYIKNYILIERFRFNNEFEYFFQVDKNINTNTIFIPPMLLQPLVENAIIHGLKPSKKKFKKISVIVTGNTIEIIDNGVGLSTGKDNKILHQQHHSKGIELLNEKIQVYSTLYPSEKIKFEIKNVFFNNQVAGTKATIKIIKND